MLVMAVLFDLALPYLYVGCSSRSIVVALCFHIRLSPFTHVSVTQSASCCIPSNSPLRLSYNRAYNNTEQPKIVWFNSLIRTILLCAWKPLSMKICVEKNQCVPTSEDHHYPAIQCHLSHKYSCERNIVCLERNCRLETNN